MTSQDESNGGRVQAATEQREQKSDVERAVARQTPKPGPELAIRGDQDFWDKRQLAALHAIGIKPSVGTGDLAVFLHYCHKTQLDPFSRQIYLIERRQWNSDIRDYEIKQTIQVGIDGFRVIRERAARRDGVSVEFEDTIWYDPDGGEHGVWLTDTPPAACRVVLLKNGYRFPAVLRTAAYIATGRNGDPIAQWKVQAEHMIEKACEAFASRRAFPQDLGGVYIEEEMGHRDPVPELTARPAPKNRPGPRLAPPENPGPAEPVTSEVVPDPAEAQPRTEQLRQKALRQLHALFGEAGLAGDDSRPVRLAVIGVLARENREGPPAEITSSSDLSLIQAQRVAADLKQIIKEAKAGNRDLLDELVSIAHAAGWGEEHPGDRPVEDDYDQDSHMREDGEPS